MYGKRIAFGLGSNLGDSLENLRAALSEIKSLKNIKVLKVSSIYESDALVPEGAPSDWNKNFLNAAVLVDAEKSVEPTTLLQEIKKIETKLGRAAAKTWAPRVIDIDILYWSEGPFKNSDLQIPHRSLLERPFALLPLLQVWPDLTSHLKERLPTWSQSWIGKKPFNTKLSDKVWPRLVGILNVTPDSFSGDGVLLNEKDLELQLQTFDKSGVDIIDFGAESTRPQATAISREQELKRLDWALGILSKSGFKFQISLDSRRSEVVKEIITDYHIDFLNDVSGFESAVMREILSNSDATAFVMHSLSVPPAKDKVLSDDKNPCEQLCNWWQNKLEELNRSKITAERVVFDPGIGFGKSPEQSLFILKNLSLFSDIKNEIMIGHSRKSFQTLFSKRKASERDLETAMITAQLNLAYVQYLRIHDSETQMLALRSGSHLC